MSISSDLFSFSLNYTYGGFQNEGVHPSHAFSWDFRWNKPSILGIPHFLKPPDGFLTALPVLDALAQRNDVLNSTGLFWKVDTGLVWHAICHGHGGIQKLELVFGIRLCSICHCFTHLTSHSTSFLMAMMAFTQFSICPFLFQPGGCPCISQPADICDQHFGCPMSQRRYFLSHPPNEKKKKNGTNGGGDL